MLGKRSSVSTRLLEKYPKIIVWHCLNHRIELSIHDAIHEVTAINHFQHFFDKLYSLYSRSTKSQRELAECCHTLEVEVKKIGRILDTGWVASTFRTVSAVLNNFQALCVHFEQSSEDSGRNSKDRATFMELLRRLRSPEFVTDLALMFDTIYELSNLSQMLQDREITIVSADKLIRRTIRRLENLQLTLGSKSLEAQNAADSLVFHNANLIHNDKIVTINKKKLIEYKFIDYKECLVQRMKDRLFITTFSRLPNGESQYIALMNEFNVLNKDSWPIENQPGYGEPEIKALSTRFNLEVANTVNAFCDYYDNLGSYMSSALKPLNNCIKLVPCGTAECERGFSYMNIILDDRRTRLLISHISSLLFIKLKGPQHSKWDPIDYARLGLRNHRNAVDTQIKGKHQIMQENPIWKHL